MTIEIANSEETIESLQKQARNKIPNDDGSASGIFNGTKKRVLPLGKRLLVKRRKVGKKLGSGIIVATDNFAEGATDIADVVHAPERTMADKSMLENAEALVESMMGEAKNGNAEALNALRWFNDYLYEMAIQPGDIVIISKYRGTDFTTTETKGEALSVVSVDDVVAVIKDNG